MSARVQTRPPAEARQDAEITANNLAYFGEPVYEYGLAQAIEDGYLAACDIQKGRVNLDDTGITVDDVMARRPVDAVTGLPMTREPVAEYYVKTQYEDRILLPDRVQAMCQDLFDYLLGTGGPEQKTIIFCARDRHADDVATQLNNLYATWCAGHGVQRQEWYAFKCTAASSGNDQLPDLRASSRSHFIATTVDLLTTGVDVPCVRNIVFFKYLKSPISFYQMIGRGMRIDAPTRQADVPGLRLHRRHAPFRRELHHPAANHRRRRPGAAAPTAAGTDHQRRWLRRAYHRRRPLSSSPTWTGWRCPCRWKNTRPAWPRGWCTKSPPWPTSGCAGSIRRCVRNLSTRWSPPVIRPTSCAWWTRRRTATCTTCWRSWAGAWPRARADDRTLAFTYKHEDWINALPVRAAAAIRAIASQFERGGTDGLENPQIFRTPEVRAAGGLAALHTAGDPRALLVETKARMFAA